MEVSDTKIGDDEDSTLGDVSGFVFDIAHFSSHDGPGIRTVVFMQGCPLDCVWCHSPDSECAKPVLVYLENKCISCGLCIDVCPVKARYSADGSVVTDRARCDDCGLCAESCPPQALQVRGHRMTAREVVREVLQDAVFFRHSGGGVTLSGGEATAQPAFAEAILRLCRAAGVETAVETCGFASPAVMRRLAPLIDLFLFDLKHLDSERHRELCGQPNEIILSNLHELVRQGREIIIRYPVIPGYNDDEENLVKMAALLRETGLRKVDLMPYNAAAGARYRWLERSYALEGCQPPTPERLEEIRRALGI